MGAVGHVGGRVGEDQVRRPAAQAARDECRVRGVALEKAMGTQLPAGAGGDPAGLAVVGRQGFLEAEPLRPGPFLALVEAGQQILEIGLGEAAQREVPRRRLLQVDQQAGQQVGVPLPADAVQGDVEQAGILLGDVEQDHGDGREAGTAGGDEPLVAGDHAPVGAPARARGRRPRTWRSSGSGPPAPPPRCGAGCVDRGAGPRSAGVRRGAGRPAPPRRPSRAARWWWWSLGLAFPVPVP